MDCPICFNLINNSAIGSCTHHFCLSCLVKWCEFGGIILALILIISGFKICNYFFKVQIIKY